MRPCAPTVRIVFCGVLLGALCASLRAADEGMPSGSKAIAPATPALPPEAAEPTRFAAGRLRRRSSVSTPSM